MTNLPDKLREHLKKFSDRSLNFKPIKMPGKVEVVQKLNIPTEFSDIITNYKKLKMESTNEKSEESERIKENYIERSLNVIGQTSTNATRSKIGQKNVTLQELREKIQSEVISGKEIPLDEKILLDNFKNREPKHTIRTLQSEEVNNIIAETKYNTSHNLTKKTEKDYRHLIYPEKILIPKNKLKYGNTYKLNDCYYDSDGIFLYRVPGMG